MPCEASGDETDMSDSDPCLRALDGFLEVLGKTPASPEPCEGALHDQRLGRTELLPIRWTDSWVI